MNAATVTAVIAGIGCAGGFLGFAWRGGQLVQILRELRNLAEDHEKRIRLLEAADPRHRQERRR